MSGAAVAALVGTAAAAAGGTWAIVLVAYFVSATLLSHWRAAAKQARTEGRIEKGGPRDGAQVAANGAVFALAAIGNATSPDVLWQSLAAAALGASAADTWATEIGTLARGMPRSIIDGTPVATGTSGGVTALGFLAAAAGATFIALVVLLVGWPASAGAAAFVGGIGGALVDSILGASIQARRWCATCGSMTERRIHGCGRGTALRGGVRWLNNDGVNAVSTLAGALLGASAARWL